MEPADTAWTLEPGSDLVVQLHMMPTANRRRAADDRPVLLRHAADARADRVKLEAKAIDIPAGEANYVVEDSYVLPADVDAVSVYPHAHYLAKRDARHGDAARRQSKPLIWIRQWDFRWQDQYRYQTPLLLPQRHDAVDALHLRQLARRTRTTATVRRSACAGDRGRPTRWARCGWRSCRGAPEDAPAADADYFRRALRAEIAARRAAGATPGPATRPAHNMLATRYLQAGRVAEAQAQLEEALRLEPGDAEAHSNLGTVLQMQGRLPEAMQHLRAAVRLKPGRRSRALQSRRRPAAGGERRRCRCAKFRRAIAAQSRQRATRTSTWR